MYVYLIPVLLSRCLALTKASISASVSLSPVRGMEEDVRSAEGDDLNHNEQIKTCLGFRN